MHHHFDDVRTLNICQVGSAIWAQSIANDISDVEFIQTISICAEANSLPLIFIASRGVIDTEM